MAEPSSQRALTVFSPAKVNLFLHITGKRKNGYHTLDSLISFADIGDKIEIRQAEQFSFQIEGAFSDQFTPQEHSALSNSDNLVVKAAQALSKITQQPLNIALTLKKDLPLASGLGGGSANAAATLWGLHKLWGLPVDTAYLQPLLVKLGADVPVCFYSQPTRIGGIGEVLGPAPEMPEIPVLLVNPNVSCPTKDIFLHHSGAFREFVDLPLSFNSLYDLVTCLKTLENDLHAPAVTLIPEIDNCLNALSSQERCLIAQMSGSGATCFGLFETLDEANSAKQAIAIENPDWWMATGHLNRVERY